MAIFTAVILRGKAHVRRDGTTNVKVRIDHRRTTAYISTDQYVTPDRFANGRVRGRDDIALCLGHSNPQNRVTDVYIRKDQGIIDSCVLRVIERVEG
jgi:hypothetical protein